MIRTKKVTNDDGWLWEQFSLTLSLPSIDSEFNLWHHNSSKFESYLVQTRICRSNLLHHVSRTHSNLKWIVTKFFSPQVAHSTWAFIKSLLKLLYVWYFVLIFVGALCSIPNSSPHQVNQNLLYFWTAEKNSNNRNNGALL